jgi:hypothetical protein
MAKLEKSVSGFGTYRGLHTKALGAAQLMPLTGDGPRADALMRRGGSTPLGYYYGYPPLDGTDQQRRQRLVEARYLDWSDAKRELDTRRLRAA